MPDLRKHLQKLKPYPIPVKPDGEPKDLLKLDANENFFPLDDAVIAAAKAACEHSQGYPDDFSGPVRQAIAQVHDLNADQICCARGAMELISLIASLYLEPGRNAVVTRYGYLYFRAAINYSGAKIRIAPEKDLTVDVQSLIDIVDADTEVVFLANPANPTGTYISSRDIRALRSALPANVLLVVDEAYAEYVDESLFKPNFRLVDQGNTIVLRTFSKIYGLAGYRIGWGYFPEKIATDIRIIQQPNCVSHVSQMAARAAMLQQERVTELRRRNTEIRGRFCKALKDLGLTIVSSQTNFVLVHFGSEARAADTHQYLRDNGILIRPMTAYGLPEYLRITIGSGDEMEKVAAALETRLKK